MRLLGQKLLPLLGVDTDGSGSSTSSGSSHSRVPSDIRTTNPRGNSTLFSTVSEISCHTLHSQFVVCIHIIIDNINIAIYHT